MTGTLRATFLSTTYGPAGERFGLAAEAGPAPGPVRGNWAVVTAWNPGGERASAQTNARAAALLAQVRAAGFVPLHAHNGQGEWREDALLVPGAGLRQAVTWGAAFGQAAVLWGTGRRAALVWLDGEEVTGVDRRWVRRLEPQPPPGS